MQRQLEERACKRPLRSNSDEAAPPERLSEQLGAPWQRRGHARAGGGRRRFRHPSGRQPQAQRRPGGTSCRCRARDRFACACAWQLCAQQGHQAGYLCRVWSAIPKNRANGVVASTASWAPCQSGRPLHTTSMRRPSWMGTSRFMAAQTTLRRLPGRPARWPARSERLGRRGCPDVAQAARWSPYSSAGAGTRAKRQGEAKALEEEDPKVGRGDGL